MTSLSALLSSAQTAAKKRGVSETTGKKPRYPYSQSKKAADALVLIVHLTLCLNCHREHRSPNKILLTRFDNLMPGFEGPLSYLKGSKERKRLPREIIIYRHYCAFCEDCFEADTISDDNRYYDKRWGEDKIDPVYLRDDPEFDDEPSTEDSENKLGAIKDDTEKEKSS